MTDLITLGLKVVPKAERQALVESIRDAILSGEQNPLDAEIALKGIEDIVDMVRKEIRYYALTEASKYGKTFDHAGATIQLSDRRTYDFTGCNDKYWQELKYVEKTASEARKERETFLKAIPPEGVVLPTTGEIINAPAFTISEILTIKIR